MTTEIDPGDDDETQVLPYGCLFMGVLVIVACVAGFIAGVTIAALNLWTPT